MKNILILLFALSILSCKDTNNNSNQLNTGFKGEKISTDNSKHYSYSFLKDLDKNIIQNATLDKNRLILGENDIIEFPKEPKIGETKTLYGIKEGLEVTLIVTRVNQSTIDYNIELKEEGKNTYTSEGSADLSTGFYLGDETDENELTGNAYTSYVFSDKVTSDCYVNIRLGIDDATSNFLLGKLIKNCNIQIQDIDLTNCPNLVEK